MKIITVIDASFSLYLTNHSYGHSPISTASGQLAGQFQFWLWVSWGKNNAVYNGGFDFQYVYAP